MKKTTLCTMCGFVGLVALVVNVGCGKEPGSSGTNKLPPIEKTDNPATGDTSGTSGGTGATGTKATTASASGAPTLTAAELDRVVKADKKYKILLIVKTLNNPFFKPMVEEFKKTAESLGVQGDVQSAPQETDVDKQAALVQNAAAQGYKAICITPADSKALAPALKAASDKGLIIINVDNRLDSAACKSAGLKIGGYVGADNEAGGRMAGEALLNILNNTGKVVIIEGIRGVDNAEARRRGFEEAVKGKFTIVDRQSADWMTEKAQKVMQNLLAAHPDINGVFCANDEMAIGAIVALKNAGKAGLVKVVSYDNIVEIRPYLKGGELYATIEQHPDLMGQEAARLAVGVLDGKIKPGGEMLVELEEKLR